MTRSIQGRLAAIAAVAVLTVPAYGSAQTETTSPQTTTAQPTAPSEDAARVHLTAARNSLSQLTQLPAATQLTGDARTQVSQLITNFNELITTKADWRTAYAKVETNLTALLGAQTTDESVARASGVAGAVGTTGTVSGIDPAIRAKLMEFRDHLDKFEAAAGGQAAPAPAAGANPPAAAATGATASPAPPATAPPAATPSSAAPPTSTPPAAEPPAAAPPTAAPDQPAATAAEDEEAVPVDPGEVVRHIEAIEVILNAQAAAQAAVAGTVGTSATASGSTRTSVAPADVTLTRDQIEQLRTHLAELRRIIGK